MGVCTSAGGTVQLLDDDSRTEAESNRISERDTAIEQHMRNLEHHIADLTLKIQQLEDNATNKDEQIDSLKKELVELENDVTAIRTDFKNLQSELQRKPTSTSITILHADAVNATDAATHSKTSTHYTANEMLVDNSTVSHVNTKEKHNSDNKSTEIRTDNTNQIPSQRPNWKRF